LIEIDSFESALIYIEPSLAAVSNGGIIGLGFSDLNIINSNQNDAKYAYEYGATQPQFNHDPIDFTVRLVYSKVFEQARLANKTVTPLLLMNGIRGPRIYFSVGWEPQQGTRGQELGVQRQSLYQVSCDTCPYFFQVEAEEDTLLSKKIPVHNCPECGGHLTLSSSGT
jgi:tRNA G26 N,N-dimethylase Trm1